MYPGLSEADCRVAEFRYRELLAETERQRLTATACARKDRRGVTETLQCLVGALMVQAIQLLQGVHTQEATEHVAAPGTLAMSK